MQDIKIGDTLFYYKCYRLEVNDNIRDVKIIGETSKSWIIDNHKNSKVSKLTLTSKTDGYDCQYYTDKTLIEYQERSNLIHQISKRFFIEINESNKSLSLEKIKKIYNILENK